MDLPSKRRRIQANKFPVKQNFFLRLWFSSTNTYSETLHINNAQFYKYDDEEKSTFQNGTVVTLKEGNKEVSAIVLARGTYDRMEQLTSYLEGLADEHCHTGEVIRRIHLRSQDQLSDSESNHETTKEKAKIDALRSAIHAKEDRHVQSDDDTQSYHTSEDDEFNKENVCVKEVKPPHTLHRSKCHVSLRSKDKLTSEGRRSASHLILAELRLLTSLFRNLVDEFRNLNDRLRFLQDESDIELPKQDAIFNGHEGEFSLSSIQSQNPNIFARNFIRKKFSINDLSTQILCPRGRTERDSIRDEDVQDLKRAIQLWFGSAYSWRAIVSSVNQMLREIKSPDNSVTVD